MTETAHFTRATLAFLRELRENNDREWFHAHRRRWQRDARDPALRFIVDFGPRLERIAPRFRADPRAVGGSLFRIHRDVRFAADKRPYKTHLGIQFRHARGKDVHAPGFYLHIEPGGCFAAMGMWHPDSASLRRIRSAIAEESERWVRARDAVAGAGLALEGDSLVRAPRGFDAAHPRIEDLRRKDFIVARPLRDAAVVRASLADDVAGTFAAGAPLMRWLCHALALDY